MERASNRIINELSGVSIESALLSMLVAGYQYDNWELAAYANNVTDRYYDAVRYQNGFVTVYSPPREAGLRLTWRL